MDKGNTGYVMRQNRLLRTCPGSLTTNSNSMAGSTVSGSGKTAMKVNSVSLPSSNQLTYPESCFEDVAPNICAGAP